MDKIKQENKSQKELEKEVGKGFIDFLNGNDKKEITELEMINREVYDFVLSIEEITNKVFKKVAKGDIEKYMTKEINNDNATIFFKNTAVFHIEEKENGTKYHIKMGKAGMQTKNETEGGEELILLISKEVKSFIKGMRNRSG